MLTLISLIILCIGALNWLLIGIFNWNLILAIFGGWTIGPRIIYVIVGLAMLWMLYVMIARRDIISFKKDFDSYTTKNRKNGG